MMLALAKRRLGAITWASMTTCRRFSVEDGRQVLVGVGVPVEAPAVDGEVEADDSTAVAGPAQCGVCGQVADDGELVHEDAPGAWRRGRERAAVPPPGVQLLAYLCASSYASMMYL